MREVCRAFLLAVAVALAVVQPSASALASGAALAPLPVDVDYTDKGLSREVLGFLGYSRLDYGLQYLDYAAVSTSLFSAFPRIATATWSSARPRERWLPSGPPGRARR